MSSVSTYKVLINRLETFANSHFQLRRFTTGQVDIADLEKEGEYPWMHVVPTDMSYSPGVVNYSFDVIFADLPRDKSDKTEYQVQSINDMELIARDLIAEIRRGNTLFGNSITLSGDTATTVPFMEEYKHVLTGVTLSFTLEAPFSWNPCDVPADYAITRNTGPGSTGYDAREVRYYADLATFPETGIEGILYGAFTENLLYYWNGSVYVAWGGGGGGGGLTLGETSTTAYRGDRGKTAFDHSQTSGNPHNTTAGQVGADPAGTASALVASEQSDRQAADQTLQDNIDAEATTRGNNDASIIDSLNNHVADTGNPHSVTKAQVGLGNADNTSDANKPVSTAQQTAIDAVGGTVVDFSATSGLVGFTGAMTRNVFKYVKIGRLVNLWVDVLGQSNTTTLTFNLPFAPIDDGFWMTVRVQNNSADSSTPGRLTWSAGNVLADARRDGAGAAWTASNNKGIRVGITYFTNS